MSDMFFQMVDMFMELAREGITNARSPVFCSISFFASIVTIAGFVSIFFYYRRIRISKHCQQKIIIDLIRHFFINCVIIEIIRAKSEKEKFAMRPTDGVFSRFAVLDTDMCLERFSVNSRDFEMIHEIGLLFRNYNIVTGVAEKHFADRKMSNDLKIQVLNDLFFRAVKATKLLFELSKRLKLGVDEATIASLLKAKSATEETKTDSVELATKGLWPAGIEESDILRPRDLFPNHSYYDVRLGLTDIFDLCILQHATSFYFIPANTCEAQTIK